ncbi:MAG: DUF3667 domain-containing protein [Gemmatirosa sp.]
MSTAVLLDDPPASVPTHAPVEDDARCPNCGAARPERYCPRCGEPRVEADELTMRHFAAHAFEQVTNVDGTLWRTVRTLLLRPGELTVEYFAGRRRRYAKPLQLFLLVNVAVLLVMQVAGIDIQRDRRTLRAYETGTVRSAVFFKDSARVRRLVALRQERSALTHDSLAVRFDARRDGMGQTAWLLIVPALAGALALLYVRRRAPFLRHLICAVHLSAFLSATMLLLVLTFTLIAVAVRRVMTWLATDGANVDARVEAIRSGAFDLLGSVVALAIGTYLFRALRRVYPGGWGWTLARTLLLCLALPVLAIALFNDVTFLLALATA